MAGTDSVSEPIEPVSPPDDMFDDDREDSVEQPPATKLSPRRSTPSGLPVTPTKPKCSPPLNPLRFPPAGEREKEPTALPMPKAEILNGAANPFSSVTDIDSGGFPSTRSSLGTRGDDGLFSGFFPTPGKPFVLEEALRAMYMKQDEMERRFESWMGHIMEHLQQRLAFDISEQLNANGMVNGMRPAFPWQLRPLSGSTDQSRSGGLFAPLSNVVGHSAKKSTGDGSTSTTLKKTRASARASSRRRSRSPGRTSRKAQSIVAQQSVTPGDMSTTSANMGMESMHSAVVPTHDPSEEDASRRASLEKRASIQQELSALKDDMNKYKSDTQKRDEMKKAWKKKSRRARGKSKKSKGDLGWEEETALSKLVNHPFFDAICAVMILFNSVLIGLTVEHTTKHPEEAEWMTVLGHTCNGFFFVELVMRMANAGREYFVSEDRIWNIFDFTLVTFSVIDLVMVSVVGESGSSITSGMKTIKMLRIVRIFRVFRFFRELSLLALMIADSIKSLAWSGILVMIIIYVFAICFTQSCSDFRRLYQRGELDHTPSQSLLSDVNTQFGSLPATIYYLILSMLGGISWGEVSDTLMHVDHASTFLFFFYMAFVLLAVLNIITGVFVDNAVEKKKTERDFLAQKELELREKYVSEMRELFHDMDEDGSGTVSWEEMDDHFSDARVRGYFAALGIDPDDMSRLFQLIDDDNSGEVEVDEFLDGCLRLKGEAKSIDVHTVLHECRKLHHLMEDVFCLNPEGDPADNAFKSEDLDHESTFTLGRDSEDVEVKMMEGRSTVNEARSLKAL